MKFTSSTGLFCLMKEMEIKENRSKACPMYFPGILITKPKKSLVRDKSAYSISYQDIPSCTKCINSRPINDKRRMT